MLPADLLNILIDREAKMFEARFRAATAELLSEMAATAKSVADLNETISDEIQDIANTLGWADSKVDDTASDISRTKAVALVIKDTLDDVDRRLVGLLKHAGATDPVKEALRSKIVEDLATKFKEDPSLVKGFEQGASFSLQAPKLDLFTKDELRDILLEAAKKARDKVA